MSVEIVPNVGGERNLSRLRKIRESRDLSQKQLTQMAQIEKSAVSRYERFSLEKARVDVVEKLADALNVSPAYLVGWSDDKDSKRKGNHKATSSRLIRHKKNLSVVDGLSETNRLVYSSEKDPLKFLMNPDSYVTLYSKDDSMLPEIQKDSLIFVNQQAKPKVGDRLALFVTGIDHPLIRIMDTLGDHVIYKPLDPSATVYTAEQVARIIGRVIYTLNTPN